MQPLHMQAYFCRSMQIRAALPACMTSHGQPHSSVAARVRLVSKFTVCSQQEGEFMFMTAWKSGISRESTRPFFDQKQAYKQQCLCSGTRGQACICAAYCRLPIDT